VIDIYFWTTPNAYKLTMFLEEANLEYRTIPVNISEGEQFDPEFLKIAPNNRIPAMVDQSNGVKMFESGAILLYLADKHKRFIGTTEQGRAETLTWLFWQMAGLGPMAGQNHHFVQYAHEQIPYAITRYVNETNRLYGVINKRLEDREFVIGDEYTIADMAIYPWIVPHQRQKQNLDDFPALKRWFHAIGERPATKRAYEKGKLINTQPTVKDEEARKHLFGQTSAVVKKTST
jgi:GST-like protein